jgi:hypothetical protein
MRAEFFIVELKAQQDKENRNITLGDNHRRLGGDAVAVQVTLL